ncbi:MAG: hypothetical protein V1876_04170 [Candidatus Peregrinibacteria bacterium]
MATETQTPNPNEHPINETTEKPCVDGMKGTTTREVKGVLEQALSEEIATVWQMAQEQIPALRGVSAAIQKKSRFHGGKTPAPKNEEDSVSFEFTDADHAMIKELMQHRKKSVEMVARDLGIKVDAVTPRLLKVFIFLHEIGHVHDYLTNFLKPLQESGCKNPKTTATEHYQERNKQDYASLPIPNGASSGLAMWTAIPAIFWDAVKRHMPSEVIPPELARMTPAELVALQEAAYKATTGERIADTFAADFIKKNGLIARFS